MSSDQILFSKKIKCMHCGKNFKAKKMRKRRCYICAEYDNFGKCKREVIDQEFLLELLDRRYKRRLSPEEIKKNVEIIEVEAKNRFEIHLKDAEPIIFSPRFIQY